MFPGKRIPDGQWPENPGEYSKHKTSLGVVWFFIPPKALTEDGPDIASIRNHTVIEHEDGTITVSPSILVTYYAGDKTTSWHGYLEKGIWREC